MEDFVDQLHDKPLVEYILEMQQIILEAWEIAADTLEIPSAREHPTTPTTYSTYPSIPTRRIIFQTLHSSASCFVSG
jgi:hypothetical protein